ncbi:MAG: Zn-dependent hydrolase [Elusimicrobia bacterium CG08_land_8_20_14_0_20_59_10]|nr:MAG: Zn-dependent hydrolase [Elusimicrobia bacterium CG08_land_8_20_14_0_20_59_10]
MRTEQFRLGPMDNFSYLLWDEKTLEAAVIDPAWQPGKLDDFIKAGELLLKCVLLTHAHPDHVNGVPFFTLKDKELPVYLHEADAFMLEHLPPVLKPLADGETLEAGTLKISVLHTPGHTPGSVCYLAGRSLFAGDTLFIGECGRVDLPGSSPEALYDSFVKLAALPDDLTLYPGHSYNGDTSTLGVQKEYNLYLKLARTGRREDFLKAAA